MLGKTIRSSLDKLVSLVSLGTFSIKSRVSKKLYNPMTKTLDHRQEAAISFLSRIATNTNQIQSFQSFEELGKRKSVKTMSSISVDSIHDPLVVYTFQGMMSLFTLSTNTAQKRVKNRKKTIQERMGFTIDQMKRKAESYQNLLEPSGVLEKCAVSNYDPQYLDNPHLQSGRNKTVITLPSFLGTILVPSNPTDLKKDLNQHFKDTHPGLDTISLSQIRQLKNQLISIGQARTLELSSVGMSFVYFEKLILKNYVNKTNRKLVAGICLLLAVKVNDPKDTDYVALLDLIAREMEVSVKEIRVNEFPVYAALEFSLFIPFAEIETHLERIQRKVEIQF
jgi:hypothetical protein